MGTSRLLQPARAVDLVWRDPRRPGRAGLAERPPVALAPTGGDDLYRRHFGGIGRPLMMRPLVLSAGVPGAPRGPPASGGGPPEARAPTPPLARRARRAP